MKTPTILLVEDEPAIAELISVNLRHSGFRPIWAIDGAAAQVEIDDAVPDLILLDWMLPGESGLNLAKKWLAHPRTKTTPIIMLTAKAAEIDRVLGLELGADDYVTKPFSPRELTLRIKGLLRRRETRETKAEQMKFGELTVDVPAHRVTVNGKPIELTATEFKLLTLLAQRRGRVQSRDQLLKDVWEYDNMIDTRTVDTHMRRLREKLGKAAHHLDTVRGVGYRFVAA